MVYNYKVQQNPRIFAQSKFLRLLCKTYYIMSFITSALFYMTNVALHNDLKLVNINKLAKSHKRFHLKLNHHTNSISIICVPLHLLNTSTDKLKVKIGQKTY